MQYGMVSNSSSSSRSSCTTTSLSLRGFCTASLVTLSRRWSLALSTDISSDACSTMMEIRFHLRKSLQSSKIASIRSSSASLVSECALSLVGLKSLAEITFKASLMQSSRRTRRLTWFQDLIWSMKRTTTKVSMTSSSKS